MGGTTSSNRIDGLDVLRAAAALMVIVCHAAALGGWSAGRLAWPIGRAGRQLFLLLSGFLLFLPYARAVYAPAATQRASSPALYALKRVLRVLPLYFTAVLALSALGFIRHWPGTAKNLVYHLLFIHTFDETTIYGLIPALWFIGVIVHWYIALPFLGWLWLKLKHRLAVWVAATCLTTAAVGALPLVFPSPSFALVAVGNKGLLGALPFLFAGMTAAALSARARQRAGAPLRALPIALVAPAALVVVAGLILLRHYGGTFAAPFALAGVLLLCARASSGGEVLAPVRAFGRASYSAFVWHMPVMIALLKLGFITRLGPGPAQAGLLLAMALPLTVAVSFASYQVLEKPFFTLSPAMRRRILRRLGLAYSSLTTLAGVVPLAISPDAGARAKDGDSGAASTSPPRLADDAGLPPG
jgi:exopolysaccharide production protein ExoZ